MAYTHLDPEGHAFRELLGHDRGREYDPAPDYDPDEAQRLQVVPPSTICHLCERPADSAAHAMACGTISQTTMMTRAQILARWPHLAPIPESEKIP